MILAIITALTLAIVILLVSVFGLLAWMGHIADEVDRHR